jgi:hypothetical protein
MYISHRGAFIRNLAAGSINSLITLVLLLIAPLGLAAVITNTIAVGISTFIVCTALDGVTLWLLNAYKPPRFQESWHQQQRTNLEGGRMREIETRRDKY